MNRMRRANRQATRLLHLCTVNGSLDEARARDVVQRAIAGGHADGLAVVSRFLRLVKIVRAAQTATVESAVPLPIDLRGRIEAGLAERYGRTIAASFEENRGLIGGLRIRVGSDVYDGSVRGGLAALEARFR